MLGVVGLERLVDGDGAVEVLLVPPARHVEGRHGHPVEVLHQRFALPEGVEVGVPGKVLPGGVLAVQVLLVHVGERAQAEEPVVDVGLVELELGEFLPPLHHRDVLEAVGQPEGAVVVEVVAQEHRGRRRLGRHRLERRVGVEHRHDGEPARIRHAEHPDPPVVAGHVLEQPRDGVPGVGALVDRLGVLPVARRTEHDELALGGEAAPDVLEDEDEALFGQLRAGNGEAPGGAADPVRRAGEDERQAGGDPLRGEDPGVELDPVAHRDHRLGRVERGARGRLGLRLGRRGADRGGGNDEQEAEAAAAEWTHRLAIAFSPAGRDGLRPAPTRARSPARHSAR